MRLILPVSIIFLLCVGIGFFALISPSRQLSPANTTTTSQSASVAQIQTNTASSTTADTTPTTTSTPPFVPSAPKKTEDKPRNEPPRLPPTPPSPPVQVARVEVPYSTPAESFEKIDLATRAALVNILCIPQGGTLRPISGSGVIIDPRGVILTNAHVAQYVLLSESPKVNLTCSIRTGSPAAYRWRAAVLYIPPVWVYSHYQEVNANSVTGTGEHDYALLQIISDMQGAALTEPLPYLELETRANVAFQGDPVLAAGYPAEFVGGIAAQQNLYAITAITTIKQLLTFTTTPVDVFALGSVVTAQGGSSGGALVNPWRKLVGIITTTSEGATTAERELHALSVNYIERDIVEQTSKSLKTILSGDTLRLTSEFSRETAPTLIQKYIEHLAR